MSQTRMVRLNGVMRTVVRIHSSGMGTQYSILLENNKVIPLSHDYAEKNPDMIPWLEACQKAFDDTTTFAKPAGENISGA